MIDYTREDFAREDQRYDVILDTAGNRPLSRLRRALAPRGTLVIVGGEAGHAREKVVIEVRSAERAAEPA